MGMLGIYLLVYVLIILVIEHTSFFRDVPILKRIQDAFPILTTPMRCALCGTWWWSLLCVCHGWVSGWWLLLPWLSDDVSRAYDLLKMVFVRISVLLRLLMGDAK